jgi:hypothetical protein
VLKNKRKCKGLHRSVDEIRALAKATEGKPSRTFHQMTYKLMMDINFDEISSKPIRAHDLHVLVCNAFHTRFSVPIAKCQSLDKTAMGSTLAMYVFICPEFVFVLLVFHRVVVMKVFL